MDTASDVPAQLERVFAADITFGGRHFRPEQVELARREARHRTLRWDKLPHAPLMLQEAGPGIGKTFVELFNSGMFALDGDRQGTPARTVIAIHTIGLRQQIADTVPLMQDALKASAHVLGLASPREVMVDQLVGLSQFISPSKIETLHEWAQRANTLNPTDRAEWDDFYDFMRSRLQDTNRVELHEWFAASGGKPLPLKISPLDVGLEDGSDRELVAAIQAEQRRALTADILITTHTMLRLLTWKLRSLDWAETTGKSIVQDCAPYTYLDVDEAHNLAKVTRTNIEQTINLGGVRDVLAAAPVNIPQVMAPLGELERHVGQHLSGRASTVHADHADVFHPLVERIMKVYEPMHALYQASDSQPLFQAKLETILAGFATITLLDGRSGTSDYFRRELVDADAYPILFRRGSVTGITCRAGSVARSVSSLWRRSENAINRRQFKSVVLLSGTLVDAHASRDDPYAYFRREIGARWTSGERQEVVWYGGVIPPVNVGHALAVNYPERSLDLVPTLPDGEVNPKHAGFIAAMIGYIFDQYEGKPNRVLVLCMSEAGLTQIHEAMLKLRPDLARHVIAQHSGMRFLGRPLDTFRADPQAVLLSMNWQGINAVDAEDRSIVNHLVLTKAPFMLPDERRQRDLHGSPLFRIMFDEAHWMFRQGIGRAMRDPEARFTLWVGDPRIPLPDEMCPPYPKYLKNKDDTRIRALYALFNEAISLRLFGRTTSATGLLAGTVKLGYLYRDAGQLTLDQIEVMLATRPDDLIKP